MRIAHSRLQNILAMVLLLLMVSIALQLVCRQILLVRLQELILQLPPVSAQTFRIQSNRHHMSLGLFGGTGQTRLSYQLPGGEIRVASFEHRVRLKPLVMDMDSRMHLPGLTGETPLRLHTRLGLATGFRLQGFLDLGAIDLKPTEDSRGVRVRA
jgi:hypothetical protein